MTKDNALNGIAVSRIGIPEQNKASRQVVAAIADASAGNGEHFVDPGVLAVDRFLSEEQEAEILNSLNWTTSWEC